MARVYIDNKYYGDLEVAQLLGHGKWIKPNWPEHKSKNVVIATELVLKSIASHKLKCYFNIVNVMYAKDTTMALLAGLATAYVPKEIQLAETLLS